MTRSVDMKDRGSLIQSFGSNLLNSARGNPVNDNSVVTARMRLNNNTTLELIDNTTPSMQSIRNQSKGKQGAPFVQTKAQRKKFNEERARRVQDEILQKYAIEPFEQRKNESSTLLQYTESKNGGIEMHSARYRDQEDGETSGAVGHIDMLNESSAIKESATNIVLPNLTP